MLTKKETEIRNYMDKLGISREEAEQLWEDDNSEEMLPEVAEMEKKAKANGRRYEQTTKKKPTDKPRKVDELKGSILSALTPIIEQYGKVTYRQTETEIDFIIDNIPYTLKLTKHKSDWQRKKK